LLKLDTPCGVCSAFDAAFAELLWPLGVRSYASIKCVKAFDVGVRSKAAGKPMRDRLDGRGDVMLSCRRRPVPFPVDGLSVDEHATRASRLGSLLAVTSRAPLTG